MGDLAQQIPEDEDEKEAFTAVLTAIHNSFPIGWDQWRVLAHTFEDLFGTELSPVTDSKLRFGLPTIDLVKAFYPDAKDLTERAYRHIRKILVTWPLGRALIYSPHSVVEKLHAPSYRPFMDNIRELKAQGKLTNRERTSRLLADEEGHPRRACSTPSSVQSRGRGTKRQREGEVRENSSPPPKRSSSDQATMAAVLQQQMLLFNKLIELQTEQNKKLDDLRSPAEKTSALNESYESVPDSTYDITPQQSPGSVEGNEDYYNDQGEESDSPGDEERALKEEIANAERRLKEFQSAKTTNKTSRHSTEPPVSLTFDFKPQTIESEAKFSKADPVLVQQATDCQRLETEGWKNIRYTDVQKQFQATPMFSALKVNNQFAGITPNWSSVSLLENTDLTLGAITNGLLQQRKIFDDLCENMPQELKLKVGQEFLANNSKFRKSSDALLQYVCGRRAEVIRQRRAIYKIKNNRALHEVIHSIPPSSSHLFKEPDLSQTVKDQGGIHKFFPFKKMFHRSTRFENKTTRRSDYKEKRPQFKRGPRQANRPFFNPTPTVNTKRSQPYNDKGGRNAGVQNKWGGPKRA